MFKSNILYIPIKKHPWTKAAWTQHSHNVKHHLTPNFLTRGEVSSPREAF